MTTDTLPTPRFDIIGQALSDASRTRMLCELLDGRSYTNKELASAANVTPQTATAHLRLLQDAGLVIAAKSGRCVYHRLAGREVAQTLEQLAALAPRDSLYRAQQRKAGELAQLRSCYDHLAGPLAVALTDHLIQRGLICEEEGGFRVVPDEIWTKLGVTLEAAQPGRPFARPCMDWTERRWHISGLMGRQMLDHMLTAGWARRHRHKRGLEISPLGEQALREMLGLSCHQVLQQTHGSQRMGSAR